MANSDGHFLKLVRGGGEFKTYLLSTDLTTFPVLGNERKRAFDEVEVDKMWASKNFRYTIPKDKLKKYRHKPLNPNEYKLIDTEKDK